MVDIRIPPLGESVTEGVIVRWLKGSGETVAADEPVLELETDKATMEIPAPGAGRLEIVAPQGSTVRVGTVVALMLPYVVIMFVVWTILFIAWQLLGLPWGL